MAPLDWGLGHATRCIPIINELLRAGCEVIIASEGAQKALLGQEFPNLRIINLRGYRLKYGKKGWTTLVKIILQIPKILIQIKRENLWLNRFLRQERLDAVISDNRYGLYSSDVFSVFITHQLVIKTPFGKGIENKLLQFNYRYINRFAVCWIPDFDEAHSLAGKLAHPHSLPELPLRYLGALTRFIKKEEQEIIDLLVLLSGPEPQRSILENKLVKELENYEARITLVRGLPAETALPLYSSHIRLYNHLSTSALNTVICQSALVISRSGYSSIMDLTGLGKKSILIPTPGQPEQECLAEYLFDKKIALRIRQHDFVLPAALEAAKKFPFMKYEHGGGDMLSNAIEELLHHIKQH